MNAQTKEECKGWCLSWGISRAQVAFPGNTSEMGGQELGSPERKEGRRELVLLCQQVGGEVS